MKTCFNVTRLLSDASERPLTREEHHEVAEHFKICPACQRCAQQFALLHRLMRGLQRTGFE